MLIVDGQIIGDYVPIARRRMQPGGLAWLRGIRGPFGRAVLVAQRCQSPMKTPGERLRATPTATGEEGGD